MVVDNVMMAGSNKEIKEMAARICRDYLHGSWKEITGRDIGLTRVTGGLSNWLYHVTLPPTLPPRTNEPSQVLLRLYGQMHGERALEGLITESVIFTLLSERKLGPTLHGVFPGGRIEEFINARPLRTVELANPSLSSTIAVKMANIHSMNVPITKEPVWVWETMSRWLQTALENLNSPGRVAPEHQAAVAKLQTYDLEAEADWMRQRVAQGNYPVVFCHNDLQEGNILLPVDHTELQIEQDPKLVLIDFEYCSYNYRGFDVANHFIEWMYDYQHERSPYFTINRKQYPSLEQKLLYIRSYLNARCLAGLISAEDMSREEKIILKEIEVFSLVSHLLWGCWSIVNAKMSDIPFGYWDYAVERLDHYMMLKRNATCFNESVSSKKQHDKSGTCELNKS